MLHSLPFFPFTLPGGHHPISAVFLALLLGMAFRNAVPLSRRLKPGVDFIVKKALPVGIVLLGARLDFYDLIVVGLRTIVGALILITTVLLLTLWLARTLQVKQKLGLLIGVGTAICGSSAIVAVAPVVKVKEEDIALSIAIINLLAVLTMLAFPILATVLHLKPDLYGIWCGLSIHATPQVIAAGFSHPTNGQLAAELGTVVKLTRISLLGPTVFTIGAIYAYLRRKQEAVGGYAVNYAKLVPTFVIFFLALAFLRTMGLFPKITLHLTDRFVLGGGDRTFDAAELFGQAAKWIITTAMVAVGLMTEFRALKTGGMKPFTLGLLSTAIIALLGLLLASL